MIEEALVLLACASNHGCSQTTNAYYADHPAVKEFIKHQENRAKDLAGPELVYASSLAMLAIKREASIPVGKWFSLRLSAKDDSAVLIFNIGF